MARTLLGQSNPLASPSEQRRILGEPAALVPFDRLVEQAGCFPLQATGITVLQINLGKVCNQTCRHCHVDAGPDRKERMSAETAELCLAALAMTDIPTVDLTGGAPELHPHFRRLVEQSRALGRQVIDRSNLTVLCLPSQGDLAEFLARHHVEIVASLPSFQAAQTDAQRGAGVFEQSLEGLRRLNRLGYGHPDSGLMVNLAYNPVGAFLPPTQSAMETRFRTELRRRYKVVFNRLYTLVNMPISRFLEFLCTSGNYEGYMARLAQAFNPAAVTGVMCRSTLSVGWDGTLYDCDFNQMLDLPVTPDAPRHIRNFDPGALSRRRIVTGNHCYGCTAGSGSSCNGSVV